MSYEVIISDDDEQTEGALPLRVVYDLPSGQWIEMRISEEGLVTQRYSVEGATLRMTAVRWEDI